jgi:aminoglycoside phosphotransferase family enzyme
MSGAGEPMTNASQSTTSAGGSKVVETHVSVVLLHDELALKFKKPVAFPFADFTTPEARRAACEAEVEANRRMSPDVYLGVATLTLGGRALDHAVVMRRLPAERSLATLAVTGRVRVGRSDAAGEQMAGQWLSGELRRLATYLARFHDDSPRSAAIDEAARPDALRATWRQCLDGLEPFAGRPAGGDGGPGAHRRAGYALSGRTQPAVRASDRRGSHLRRAR